MHQIITYSDRVPYNIAEQIAELTRQNCTDLSMLRVRQSSTVYPLYQYSLSTEILMYVHRVGKFDQEAPVRLVVAFSDESQNTVIGFVLYLPVSTDRKACGLTYMAVASGHRRKGVARDMMATVAEECPHIELTCFIEKVPAYESMGFHVIGYRDTQIILNNRTDPSPGEIAGLDLNPIFESPEFAQVQNGLLQKHGIKATKDDDQRVSRVAGELRRKAEQYALSRAEEIVRYRRPNATVAEVSPGLFELQGVDGVVCQSSDEREVWIKAVMLMNIRNEAVTRVVHV
jgi:GNAT superfamily N-acetyltransferase